MAGLDDEVGYYFVENAEGFGEGWGDAAGCGVVGCGWVGFVEGGGAGR